MFRHMVLVPLHLEPRWRAYAQLRIRAYARSLVQTRHYIGSCRRETRPNGLMLLLEEREYVARLLQAVVRLRR
jgi:hypothetical protein